MPRTSLRARRSLANRPLAWDFRTPVHSDLQASSGEDCRDVTAGVDAVSIARREPVSTSKIWLVTIAFLAGLIITPLFLILTTGDDEAALSPLPPSRDLESRGIPPRENPEPW